MSLKRRMKRAADQGPAVTVKQVEGFEISYAPVEEGRQPLPADAVKAIRRLHDLAREAPFQAISELREWIGKHPEVPLFYNFLAIAYSTIGEQEDADRVTVENYRRNPGYLFARVNQAEMCLRKGDLGGALEALGPQLDLRALYPERKRFHVSEFAGFYYAVAVYCLATGRREEALRIDELLRAVAPTESTTEALRRRLQRP